MMTVNSPQTQMTPSLSKFNAIDADAIAVEYPKMMTTRTRFKMGKNDNIPSARIHLNTKKRLKLDISNMIAKRYKKRRTIRVRNKALRMTRAWRSATISTCSVRSFESLDSSLDEWEQGDNNVMTDESLSRDGGNDSTSKWCAPNPCQPTVSMLAKKRWTTFVEHGRWGSFTVDDGESDEYTPPSSGDEDSYSDEFDDEFQDSDEDSDGEGDTPAVISNNYPTSIPCKFKLFFNVAKSNFSLNNNDLFVFIIYSFLSIGITSFVYIRLFHTRPAVFGFSEPTTRHYPQWRSLSFCGIRQ